MGAEETIDEGSNRTAIVLHVLAAIAATSLNCHESAIILIFRLLKDKNLDKGKCWHIICAINFHIVSVSLILRGL